MRSEQEIKDLLEKAEIKWADFPEDGVEKAMSKITKEELRYILISMQLTTLKWVLGASREQMYFEAMNR